jgi:tetratricopeptide (TPR) repeat protein
MMDADPQPGRPAETPPRRHYRERDPQAPRNVDAADRAIRLQALAWSAAVVVLVFAASSLAAVVAGVSGPLLYVIWLGGVGAGAVVYRVSTLMTETGSTLFGRIQNPTGASTPHRREYSRAKSLVTQGHFADAISAFEIAVADYPDDPEPYMAIARINRDHLRDFEQAVAWFRRARADASMPPGLELLVTQEIIEIFRNRLRMPERSIPELARLIQRFPAHPSIDVFRAELAELRRTVFGESTEEGAGQ